MVVCTFFGHRDTPDTVRPYLETAIERLILEENVPCFYVGNHGAFDRIVYSVLLQLREKYRHIRITVVLAYMPSSNDALYGEDSLLPEGIEMVPKRFAIDYRNKWMLRRADYVIAYITRSFGGAARYVNKAKQQNKRVIELQA